ncbi:MAG: hypothetical protein ACM3SM_04695 [Bacteroidota bacterium]
MITEVQKKLRAQKLHCLRKSFGFSPEHLIRDKHWKSCISLNTLKEIHTYKDFETGKRELKDELLHSIAKAFGIEQELLFDEWSLEDFEVMITEIGNEFQIQGRSELPYSS